MILRPIEDVCSDKYLLPNGQKILTVVVYISPNQRVNDIVRFIHFVLLPYTRDGSVLLGEEYLKMLMIVGRDFNTNFSSDKVEPFITLIKKKINLGINMSRNVSITNSETTIYVVFSLEGKVPCLGPFLVFEFF